MANGLRIHCRRTSNSYKTRQEVEKQYTDAKIREENSKKYGPPDWN